VDISKLIYEILMGFKDSSKLPKGKLKEIERAVIF